MKNHQNLVHVVIERPLNLRRSSNLSFLLPDLDDDIAEGYNGPGDIFISETGL